jgi:hypothetical protein
MLLSRSGEPKLKIIGFGHRRKMGKDTAANLAIGYIRIGTRRLLVNKAAYGSKIKAIAHDVYGWAGVEDEEYYELHPDLKDAILPALGKTVRDVWIMIGEAFRTFHANTWVRYPFGRYAKSDFLVISDVRRYNEADAILDRGGIVFDVFNPRTTAVIDDPVDSALDNYPRFTGTIVNDGDIALLNTRVIEAIGGYVSGT